MIKVLYVIDTLKQRFGVTSVAMNYFRHIDNRKIVIDFLVDRESDNSIVKEIENKGSSVYFMPSLSLNNIGHFFKFINVFFREHNDYKVVHSHFCQIDSIIFPIIRKYSNTICISHSHNTKYSDYPLRALRNAIMCLPLKRCADRWFACSDLAGIFLFGKKFIVSPKRYLMRNAVNCSKFAYNKSIREEVRTEFAFRQDCVVIGTVGSLKIQKNQSFVLDVFAGLIRTKKKNENFKLLLIGDGELRLELEKKATDLNIAEYVIFTGQRNDVYRLLQAIDIFVLPSLYEGLPVIGIEAQASGIKCLLSDTITKEVGICNVSFLSISNGTQIWIDAIRKNMYYERIDVSNEIINKGYSIDKAARDLADYYISLLQ